MGAAIKQSTKRWQSGIIPYVIHPEVVGLTAIYEAFAIWESRTNIRFVKRYLESDYLEFVLDAGAVGYAYSSLGKTGGRQILGCSFSFDTRVLLHEIGHALGLIHEQSRSDRDQYVTIDFDNISESNRFNFDKDADSLNYAVYDYGSLMHYGPFSFAKDRSKPVIKPVDPSIPLSALGNQLIPAKPSVGDFAMINQIYPVKGVTRRSSSQNGAGEVKEIAALVPSGSNSRIVTAVKTGADTLKLINWNIDSLGGITRITQSSEPDFAGDASDIAITQAGNKIVCAMQNGSGNLILITGDLNNNPINRIADSGNAAGPASLVKVIALTNSLVLTACRNGNGNLVLITWSIDATGRVARLTDSGMQAGGVTEISLLKIKSSSTEHIISTTVRATDGNIKVITWAVSISGNSITRRGDSGSQISAGTQLRSVIDQSGHLIVSCKSGSGNLVLISISVSATGEEISRIADTHSMAGVIMTNSLMTTSYGVVSGVSDANGNLRLIKWEINSAGQFKRIGDSASQAGKASLINLVALNANKDTPVCTCLKNDSGDLFIISWDDDADKGEY